MFKINVIVYLTESARIWFCKVFRCTDFEQLLSFTYFKVKLLNIKFRYFEKKLKLYSSATDKLSSASNSKTFSRRNRGYRHIGSATELFLIYFLKVFCIELLTGINILEPLFINSFIRLIYSHNFRR